MSIDSFKGIFVCEIQILSWVIGLDLQTYSLPPVIPQLCPIAGFVLACIVAFPGLKTRFNKWRNR